MDYRILLAKSNVESQLESKYTVNHLTILSLLERILAFRAAPLFDGISAFRGCQFLFHDVNPLKEGSLPLFQQGRGKVWMCVYRPWNISTHLFQRRFSWFQTSKPHEALFPAIKMFPELRYIWKVLENPTGRGLGQESSFSHAIQEVLHKMFALQDSPVQEPNSQGWRIMVDREAL